MKLASLIIHTAGTQNASVSLGGLSHDDALRVRDHLIDVDERDAV
jgi:membrane protein YdbS with pleckstrin-like domain